jgi:hypothetical protein
MNDRTAVMYAMLRSAGYADITENADLVDREGRVIREGEAIPGKQYLTLKWVYFKGTPKFGKVCVFHDRAGVFDLDPAELGLRIEVRG